MEGGVSDGSTRAAEIDASKPRVGVTGVRAPACWRNPFLGEARRGPYEAPFDLSSRQPASGG
jgi:hypothetical protein